MHNYTSEQPECDIEFPWGVKRLLLWLILYFIASLAISALFTIAFIYLNQYLKWELTISDIIQFEQMYFALFSLAGAYLFLRHRSHKACLSLKMIWGSLSIPFHQIATAIALGIFLSLIWSGVSLNYLNNLQPKYPHYIQFYSQLMIVGLLIPFVEEIYFRGMMYRVLRKNLNAPIAILISSSIFTIYHFPYWSHLLDIICIVTCGVVTALLFERTNSLLTPFLFHIIVNLLGVVIFQYRENFIL